MVKTLRARPACASDNRKSNIGNRKSKIVASAIMLLALSFPADAQQDKKVPRIGYLKLEARGAREDAFRQGLRERGYVEGKEVRIEWRFADGKIDQLSHLASELVRLNVDVIVTGGNEAIGAAKERKWGHGNVTEMGSE